MKSKFNLSENQPKAFDFTSDVLVIDFDEFEQDFEALETEALFGGISEKDYLRWAQFSLNMYFKKKGLLAPIAEDGKDTTAFRDAVELFNKKATGRRKYRELDRKTQDVLIRENERNSGYLRWLRTQLNKLNYEHLTMAYEVHEKPTWAIKEFQGDYDGKFGLTLVKDGYVGAKTHLALLHAIKQLKPKPPTPLPQPKPLTGKQVTLLIWGLTGQKPNKVSFGRLALEFARFTELQKLMQKPSLISLFKHGLRIYWKTLVAYFKEEPERQFGTLMGGAYSIMDVATRMRKKRKLKPGMTRAQKAVSEGFNEGYGKMQKHLKSLSADDDVKRMLQLLDRSARRTITLGRIYRALHEIAISKVGGKSLIYLSARRNCRFNYSAFKTSCKS